MKITKEKVLQLAFLLLRFNRKTFRSTRTMRLMEFIDPICGAFHGRTYDLTKHLSWTFFVKMSVDNYFCKKAKSRMFGRVLYGVKYSRMDQLKFVEDSLWNLKWYGLLRLIFWSADILKAVFQKFYLIHSWILYPTYTHSFSLIVFFWVSGTTNIFIFFL